MKAFTRKTTKLEVDLEGLSIEKIAKLAVEKSKEDGCEAWCESPRSKPKTREKVSSLKHELEYPLECRENLGTVYIVAGSSP